MNDKQSLRKASLLRPKRAGVCKPSPMRQAWDNFPGVKEDNARDLDILWQQFKKMHGFDPKDFAYRPPWCIAGAENNSWAESAFLGNPMREAAWSQAGYLDSPFHFAFLWLDFAGFAGSLGKPGFPYSMMKTRGQLKAEALAFEKKFRRLSKEFSAWMFRGDFDAGRLIENSDYANSITLSGRASTYTPQQQHIATQVMLAGARQQIRLSMAGKRGLLDRAADALKAWKPPPSLVARPHRKSLRSTYAVRWLDESIRQIAGRIPSTAKYTLIAELRDVLDELGGWDEGTWTEERVRRCLDGKSVKVSSDNV